MINIETVLIQLGHFEPLDRSTFLVLVHSTVTSKGKQKLHRYSAWNHIGGDNMMHSPFWLVIYLMSGNNATLKFDFTDPRIRNFLKSFLYAGSEMIHLP